MPTMSPSTTEKNNSPKSNNNNKNDEESPATIVSNEGEVENQIQPSSLSSQELWNVTCLVLAFSCNVCCLTLVVGGSAVAIKTVGGNDQVAPFGLGVMFLGMSLVSLTCTHWMFEAWGRKKGFFAAVVFGIVGVVIATIACYIESHELLVCSFLFLGAGCGMGMYLRFAAVEVVSPPFRAKAVTWVLAGGCIAAFVGPETAEATRGTVGDEDEQHLTYVGTFWVAGAFYVGMGIFVSLINFDSQDSAPKQVVQQQPPQASSPGEEPKNEEDDVEKPTIEQTMSSQTKTFQWEDLKQILLGQSFIIPVLVATFSWIIMAMPMGIFRLAMIQVGYTARQSLTVIELHFLGMYVPGFVSGKFIQQRGPPAAIYLSMLFSIAATVINLFSKNPDDGNIATWYFGLILLGFGWNFGFSASTVWLTGSYKSLPHLRSKVQAANECAMFFLAGIFIFSTGYIFEAGGSGLDGWKTINYVNFGMIGLMMALSTIGISGLLRAKEAETTN